MKRFLEELRRRRVFGVAAAYVVVAWLALQVADVVLPIYKAPDWILPTFTTLLFIGFPLALVLAWAFDITPGGVVRTEDVADDQATPATDHALEMPAGPAIVVLPFGNISGDPDQELFAQAMTNEIITGLTQATSLRVVTAGAAPAGGDQDTNQVTIWRDLGVRFLLQGSVNKSGSQLRVTAQLTDTSNNTQMWSASYDNEMTTDNLFAVQDDIREQIVATLGDFHGVIYSSETAKNVHRSTDNLNAYECLSVALAYDKNLSEENHLRARESLEHAVELDPDYDQAWSHLSWIYTDEVVYEYNRLPNAWDRALKAAQRAIELNPDNYHSHWLLSRVHYFSGDRESFLAEVEKSLALNANDGTTIGLIGCYLAVAGEWDRGVALVEKAKILNPRHPDYYHWFLGTADLHRHDYAAALAKFRLISFRQWLPSLICLTATSALLDRHDDAARYLDTTNEFLGEDLTLERANEDLKRLLPFADDLIGIILQGLQKTI